MKKKLIALTFAIVSIAISIPSFVFAEENTFTFRNIPWNSTKTEAEQLLVSDGAQIQQAAFKDNILRLSGINFLNTTSGSDRVDGGGIVGRYTGLKVAGYDISEAGACYIYNLNEDGTIDRNEEDAQFYFGWYAFDSNDYADAPGVYTDLSSKLTSLYGAGAEDTESDYFDTTTWNDNEGNVIRLLLGGKAMDEGRQYVSLGYITYDADERLDEMKEALYLEEKALEQEEREKNASNTDGL